MMMMLMFHIFFFFQAEDGIRDYKVTGVQTCALPICVSARTTPTPSDAAGGPTASLPAAAAASLLAAAAAGHQPVQQRAWGRSEERRVGKECRWRWRTGK